MLYSEGKVVFWVHHVIQSEPGVMSAGLAEMPTSAMEAHAAFLGAVACLEPPPSGVRGLMNGGPCFGVSTECPVPPHFSC